MHARNAGLQRLRSLTKRIGIATAVFTGVFTGFAAAANSGHHRRSTVLVPPRRSASPALKPNHIPPPPSLPPLGEQSGAPNPSPSGQSQSPPVQAQAPPVAVSGGS
jgi:hypothetical protein